MKFGVLGNSKVGMKIFPAMKASEKVELVAIGSRNPEKAKEGAAKYDIPSWARTKISFLIKKWKPSTYHCQTHSMKSGRSKH